MKLTQAQAAQQGNRTSDGKYTFGTHAEPDQLELAADEQQLERDISKYLGHTRIAEEFDRPHGHRSFSFGEGQEETRFETKDDSTERMLALGSLVQKPVTRDRILAAAVSGQLWNRTPNLADENLEQLADISWQEIERIRALPRTKDEQQRYLAARAQQIADVLRSVQDARELQKLLSSDPAPIIARWDQMAARGSCEAHEQEIREGRYNWCEDCRLAFMAAHERGLTRRLSFTPPNEYPKPPTPRPLKELSNESDPLTGWETVRTKLGVDDKLAQALRDFTGAEGEVVIIEEVSTDHSNYTLESWTQIEVEVGEQSYSFDDIGEVMRALETKARGNIYETSKTIGGPVALHGWHGQKPQIGWILARYPHQQQMKLQHIDGRQNYLDFKNFKDITKTELSWDIQD